jgi:prepilin-type N-terminal cleavage/methylation domain-containing protein
VRALLRDERGFTLIELMVVAALAPVMLAAVLVAFNGLERSSAENQAQSESQAHTRATVDQLARQLRNLASPTPEQPQAIDRAEPYDLIFQTVGPDTATTAANVANIERVRYCLNAPASGDATLYVQRQTWTEATPPPAPPATECPGGGWSATGTAAVVKGVTNRASSRAVFEFNSDVPTAIQSVVIQMWVRAAGSREPARGVLRTQVHLRNQNRRPAASFTHTATGNRNVVVNGSASTDPDGDDLVYHWFVGSSTTPAASGITATVQFPSVGSGQSLRLRVTDGAGLTGEMTQAVDVK